MASTVVLQPSLGLYAMRLRRGAPLRSGADFSIPSEGDAAADSGKRGESSGLVPGIERTPQHEFYRTPLGQRLKHRTATMMRPDWAVSARRIPGLPAVEYHAMRALSASGAWLLAEECAAKF